MSEMPKEASPRESLIGVDSVTLPEWVTVDRDAKASLWKAARTLPEIGRLIVHFAWRSSPRLTILAGIAHALSGCATAFGLLATANVFAALLEQGPTPDRVVQALPAIALVVGSFMARALLDAAVAAIEGSLWPMVLMAADNAVISSVVRVDLLAFEDADFRELTKQGAVHGVRALNTCLRQVASLIPSVISVCAALVTAALLHPVLAVVLLFAAIANGWASSRVSKLNHEHFLNTAIRQVRKAVVEEAATNRVMALERHAFTLQTQLILEYHRVSESLALEEVRLAHRSNAVRLVGRAAAGFGTAAAYVVLGFLLYNGDLPLALAGTALLAMRTASTALANSTQAINVLYENSFYIEFYNKLRAEAERRRTPERPLLAPKDPEEIRLDKVSFHYPGQQVPALRDISISIRRGEVVALVGENGSGKTTLGKVLTGLYPPSTGQVYWNEVDLATANLRSVHDNIAIIAQQPAEWPMTALHNILVGRLDKHDPDGKIWDEAVTKSGADEVIASLPQGVKTLLSKKFNQGQDLSGGQWQRIGIARGIYRDASILVADEPTAALDAKAEAKVFAGLRHASGASGSSRTTILVTHRLANVKSADRILVLDAGQIVEQGTHAELMSLRGRYHELFEIQAAAYRDPEREDSVEISA
jgi:ATP-binding cassette subfamily B protein